MFKLLLLDCLDPFGVTDPTLVATGIDPANCVWAPPAPLPVATLTTDPTSTCVVGSTPAGLGPHPNTANAEGMFAGTSCPSNPSTASYIGANPRFSQVKEISTSVAGPWSFAITVASGTPVYYRFTIVNTGGLDLSSISVTDPMVSTASYAWTDPLPSAETPPSAPSGRLPHPARRTAS